MLTPSRKTPSCCTLQLQHLGVWQIFQKYIKLKHCGRMKHFSLPVLHHIATRHTLSYSLSRELFESSQHSFLCLSIKANHISQNCPKNKNNEIKERSLRTEHHAHLCRQTSPTKRNYLVELKFPPLLPVLKYALCLHVYGILKQLVSTHLWQLCATSHSKPGTASRNDFGIYKIGAGGTVCSH